MTGWTASLSRRIGRRMPLEIKSSLQLSQLRRLRFCSGIQGKIMEKTSFDKVFNEAVRRAYHECDFIRLWAIQNQEERWDVLIFFLIPPSVINPWEEGAGCYPLYAAPRTVWIAHMLFVSFLVDIYSIEYPRRYRLCVCRQTLRFTLDQKPQNRWPVLYAVNKRCLKAPYSRESAGNFAAPSVLIFFHISSVPLHD